MTRGIVSAPQPEATEAGALALIKGGNAVDSAIACALVQTAVDPQMCGIAGFGSMHLFLPERGEHLFLDFHGRAPLAVEPNMWEDLIEREAEDGFGFILKGRVNEMGYGSITSPMSLRAYDTALKRFGTMDLANLLEPAIEYAEKGFIVRPHVSYFWEVHENSGRISQSEKFKCSEGSRKIYLKDDGSLYQPGDVLKNPDMANTLRRIARYGVDDFYSGVIADAIVADMEANNGLISRSDLIEARPEDHEPLWGNYRGYDVAVPPPPAGGVMLLEMLNILENFDLVNIEHNSPGYISVVSEAMKIATVDKDKYVGDPRYVDVPLELLCDKHYAAELANRIKSGEKTHVPRVGAGSLSESRETTQVSVADEFGNCVTMTHSLGMPSGVVTDGLGFMYNGCMAVFDPRPGNPDSLAPGKSRFTAMTPTIVFEGDQPYFVVGAPGGTFITMGILQTILNVIDFGMDAQQAVSAPRFCTTSNKIDVSNRIPRFVEADLKAKGYIVRRSFLSYHFAGVHGIRIKNGKWDGGADPGRDGMVMQV